MPRGGIPISRVQEDETEAPRQLSPWLQNVSNMLAKQHESAVDQSRVRANMINQVNNIMRNPPRYATVEDAVQDMRERTGLNEYLQKVKTADRGSDGLLTEAAAKNLVAEIKKKIANDVPSVLNKYTNDAVEDITSFVQNNIENSHGLAASVPQLQHDILHILGPKYKLQAEDIMSGEFARFLSQFIFDAQSQISPNNRTPNLGKDVGRTIDDDDESQDYWAGMMPKQ